MKILYSKEYVMLITTSEEHTLIYMKKKKCACIVQLKTHKNSCSSETGYIVQGIWDTL